MELLERAQQIRMETLAFEAAQPVNDYAGELRVISLLAGRCLFQLGGRNIAMEPGEIIIVPKTEFYRITPLVSDVRGLYIELPAALGALFEARGLTLGVQLLQRTAGLVCLRADGERKTRLHALLIALTEEAGEDRYRVYTRLNTVELILIELYRMLREPGEFQDESGMGEAKKSELIKGVISYINDHYAQDIHLDSIAKKFWVSPSYLSRQFKGKLGLNITNFIMERRVYAAQSLLLTTDLRVSEIAQRTGFRGAAYFNTVFKRIAGVSPSEYRSQKKMRGLLPVREDAAQPETD